MKKSILIAAVSIFLGLSIWKGYQIFQIPKVIQEKSEVSVLGEQIIPRVTLTLVNEESVATYSNVLAPTVFEALQRVATDNQIPLKTKQYDFGIFVEEIGNKPMYSDYAWLYFINGVSGDVAADKKTIKTGDLIEWRYVKPTF